MPPKLAGYSSWLSCLAMLNMLAVYASWISRLDMWALGLVGYPGFNLAMLGKLAI
jgi:hypothetical protein